MSADNELKSKLCLITGASGGIGSACAARLWSHGVSLALTYSTNKSSLDTLTAKLLDEQDGNDNDDDPQARAQAQRKLSSHRVDLASTADIERLFTEIEQTHGQLPDILVANAGYAQRIVEIEDIPLSAFDTAFSVNVRATFLMTKTVVPHMKARGWGRIIYMSSVAAEGGGINGCHYAMSKAAMNGLMRNLARKQARFGITVNCVAPAMIGDTFLIPDASATVGTPGDVKNIPVGRLGTPGECANVVEMLCKTGYMTGQNILITGGLA